MARISKKDQVERKKLDDFAAIFPCQNYRLRRKKDGEKVDGKPVEPWTVDDIINDVLDIHSEGRLKERLKDALSDNLASTVIINALAKAMVLDGSPEDGVLKPFERVCKDFWFTPEELGTIYEKTHKAVETMRTRENAKRAIADVTHSKSKQPLFTLSPSSDGLGQTELETLLPQTEEQKKENLVSRKCDEIPARLIGVHDLLGDEPFKQQDKPKRTPVAYRIDTHLSEIIRLGAAACNLPATQFIEKLVETHSQSLVRGHVTKFKKEENWISADICKKLYDVMSRRYSDVGDFPTEKKAGITNPLKPDGAKWYPSHDEDDRIDFEETSKRVQTKQEALQFISMVLQGETKMNAEKAASIMIINRFGRMILQSKDDEWRESYEGFVEAYQHHLADTEDQLNVVAEIQNNKKK
jgi:hypothetical protein